MPPVCTSVDWSGAPRDAGGPNGERQRAHGTRAAEKWNEAITQICRSSSAHDATSDSADTASMSYEARLLLFEALAAATRLPRALQRQLLASLGGTLAENLREETGVCSPPTSLTLACRRAASELVRAFPDDREAWRTFVRGCDELPTECAGTQEGDEGDEGDEADKGDGDDEIELEGGTFCERRADGSPTAAKARPVLEWLIKSPGSDNANQRAWTWYLLGLHTMRRGEIGVAQHAFATAARVDRFAAAPWVAYGELCLGRGNSSLAEQAFARALQLEDCNGDACAPRWPPEGATATGGGRNRLLARRVAQRLARTREMRRAQAPERRCGHGTLSPPGSSAWAVCSPRRPGRALLSHGRLPVAQPAELAFMGSITIRRDDRRGGRAAESSGGSDCDA